MMMTETQLQYHPIQQWRSPPSMESLEDTLCPTLTCTTAQEAGIFTAFSSLASLPSICEPTPIDRNNACFVEEVPLANVQWQHNCDGNFFQNLKMLIQESSLTPNNWRHLKTPSTKSVIATDHSTKRHRDMPLVDKAFGGSFQACVKAKPRRLLVSTSGSTTSEGGDYSSGIRNGHIRQWNQRYSELTAFHRELNHCLVPLNWEQNPSLAHWVKRQRHQYRVKNEGGHSTMTAERETALDDLGFVWDSHAVAWEERWGQLADFKQRFGHTNVPKKYPENPQLAVWVKCQRRQFKLYSEGKRSNTTPDRIRRLSSLGFVFNPRIKANLTF